MQTSPRVIVLLAAVCSFLTSCAPSYQPSPRRATGQAGAESGTVRMAPSERPGLGTGFGEERDSEVFGTRFVRSRAAPASVDRLYYDDAAGVRAMATSGSSQRLGGWQRVPGGLASWGVRRAGGGWLPGREIDGGRVVTGEKGERYELHVRNETDTRLEAVLSVDGLDVQDGRAAALAKRGYIIAPGATLRVEGFRTTTATVAAFRFSSVARSYAALKHGDTRNVGVIGLALFTERGREPWAGREREAGRRRRAEPFPSRWAAPPDRG